MSAESAKVTNLFAAKGLSVHVTVKNVYGNETVYPACEMAKGFCDIAGTVTLTKHMIRTIKNMGFSVEVVHPGVTL